MVGIEIRDLSYRIGDFYMKELSLTIEPKEYFVLTGPNGSGKTILVRLLCGLALPETGSIKIDGQAVEELPPWRRNIGYVPQDGVLFPNRDVRGNISFGLEVRSVKDSITERTDRIAGMLGIEHLLGRKTDGLSGGERQRVSLARALVLKPSILLMDEPVSAIDEGARDKLCEELRRIQQELGITTIHVSHNRRETDIVADRVGVLESGKMASVNEART